jgi:hypothetical protein
MNGVYLAYFYAAGDKEAAEKNYSNLQDDYYGQNWARFGLALVEGTAEISQLVC